MKVTLTRSGKVTVTVAKREPVTLQKQDAAARKLLKGAKLTATGETVASKGRPAVTVRVYAVPAQ
jgi:hypothetical protein